MGRCSECWHRPDRRKSITRTLQRDDQVLIVAEAELGQSVGYER